MTEAVRRGTLERVSQASGHAPPADGVLLNVDQVAERLGTPTRFVRRLIAERRIGFCRIGRYVRITDSDVAAFIQAARVSPATTSMRSVIDHREIDLSG